MLRTPSRWTAFALLLVLGATSAAAQVSREDIGGYVWTEDPRYGSLAPPGATYALRRDGTCVYASGLTEHTLGHAGRWSLANRGHTLVLAPTPRTERRDGHVRRVPDTLTMRIGVDRVRPGVILIDGIEFIGKPD